MMSWWEDNQVRAESSLISISGFLCVTQCFHLLAVNVFDQDLAIGLVQVFEIQRYTVLALIRVHLNFHHAGNDDKPQARGQ